MPVVVTKQTLWEVADIVERIFHSACTENLHARSEDYDAATCDYAAEHGLSVTRMHEQMRQYGTLGEVHERAQVIALTRFYARRWRPWDFGGRRVRRPWRQPTPKKRLRS